MSCGAINSEVMLLMLHLLFELWRLFGSTVRPPSLRHCFPWSISRQSPPKAMFLHSSTRIPHVLWFWVLGRKLLFENLSNYSHYSTQSSTNQAETSTNWFSRHSSCCESPIFSPPSLDTPAVAGDCQSQIRHWGRTLRAVLSRPAVLPAFQGRFSWRCLRGTELSLLWLGVWVRTIGWDNRPGCRWFLGRWCRTGDRLPIRYCFEPNGPCLSCWWTGKVKQIRVFGLVTVWDRCISLRTSTEGSLALNCLGGLSVFL